MALPPPQAPNLEQAKGAKKLLEDCKQLFRTVRIGSKGLLIQKSKSKCVYCPLTRRS